MHFYKPCMKSGQPNQTLYETRETVSVTCTTDGTKLLAKSTFTLRAGAIFRCVSCRAKSSLCQKTSIFWLNTRSKERIEQLIPFGSLFSSTLLWKYLGVTFIVAGRNPWPLVLNDNPLSSCGGREDLHSHQKKSYHFDHWKQSFYLQHSKWQISWDTLP